MNKKNLIASSLGNMLEWFSYALYGGFALNIGAHFFDKGDVHLQNILAYLIFSVGFLSRPFGAAIFGHIGDKIGRANSLFFSIAMMAIPTFCIAIVPSFSEIGIASPILLVIIRCLQGIAIGGEYTGAMVYLVEQSDPSKRGFLGSFADFGCLMGTLLGGSCITYILTSSMERSSFEIYGWKIPFFFSILILYVGYYINKLEKANNKQENASQKINQASDEKNQKENSEENVLPIKELFTKYWRTSLYVAASSAFSGVNFYTLLVFIPNYISSNANGDSTPFLYTAITNLIMLPTVLLCGVLSDKFTRKRMIFIGIVGIIFLAYPLMSTLNSPKISFVVQILYGIFLACYFGGRSAFFSEAFPKKIRCTAVSVSLSISHAIFAGTAPLLATYLSKMDIRYFVLHILFVSCFALYGFSKIKDRTGEPLM